MSQLSANSKGASDEMKTGSIPRRKALAKAISFKNYVSLGLGDIIGIGWVIVAGDWLLKGGPLGAILAFIIGGVLLIAVGKCYAELTPAIPVAGGEVAFSYKAFGTGPAFLTAWFLAFGYIFVCPFETISLGWLLENIVPAVKSPPLYSLGGYEVSLSSLIPGLAFALLIIGINYRSVKNTAIFQTFFMAAMLVCVVAFTAVALIKGDFSNMQPLFSRSGSLLAAPLSIIAVIGMVPFFMSGFDTIPQAAEESGNKVNPRDLGKAIIIAIIVGIIFYVVVILALSICYPWQESVKLEMPTAQVFRIAFGYEWASKLVLIAAFFGLITTLNATFLAASRVVFSMGRGGLLPKWFGEVSDKNRTPKNAILFVGFLTIIGSFVGKSFLLPIVTVSSLGFACAWFFTCYAAVALRKTAPDMQRPYRVKHKSTLYIGVVISGILIILMVFPGSPAQISWPLEYFILAAWIFFGYIAYRWRMRAKDLTKDERDYQILGEYR
ncbi:MAG: APC family permease [Candidatus Aminicenantes bacterium]|nr:APC family permease [Candidatus Aminicenantes bacterium]